MSVPSVRTPEGDATFFRALEHGHSVRKACGAAKYSRSSVYEWRQADADFAAAWVRAVAIAVDLLEEEADRRGRDGIEEPVYFYGEVVGLKRKYSDGLLLARLKALRPQLYGDRSGATQPKLTVVIRDVVAEALFARLVAEKRLTLADVPEEFQSHVAAASVAPAPVATTDADGVPNTLPLSGLSALEGPVKPVKG